MRRTVVIGLCASALTFGARANADGTTACTDASSQGQIQRDAHKLVEARNQFILCAKRECPGVVRKDCTTWLEQVQASVPTVVPIALDAAGNSLPAVKVSIDGKLLVDKIDGRAVEVNPGTYTFTFEAPDGTKVEKPVVVAEGEKDRRVTATLAKPEAVATAAPPPPTTIVPAPPPSSSLPVEGAPRTSLGPWKTTVTIGALLCAGATGCDSILGIGNPSLADGGGVALVSPDGSPGNSSGGSSGSGSGSSSGTSSGASSGSSSGASSGSSSGVSSGSSSGTSSGASSGASSGRSSGTSSGGAFDGDADGCSPCVLGTSTIGNCCL
jgi:hypothetical protein